MSGVGSEGPGGLADTGNNLGGVTGRADEVSAVPDAPQGVAYATESAYGNEAAAVEMATEGGGGGTEGLEAAVRDGPQVMA